MNRSAASTHRLLRTAEIFYLSVLFDRRNIYELLYLVFLLDMMYEDSTSMKKGPSCGKRGQCRDYLVNNLHIAFDLHIMKSRI